MADTHDRPPEQFTLRLRRYDPESGEAPYWDEHTVELEPHRSVLEAILQARDRFDGSIGSAARAGRRSADRAGCGSTANRHWPATPTSTRPARAPAPRAAA